MDLATILATFPPDVREEVLLTSEEDVINSLPPALLAEAQQLRQRVMQHYRYTWALVFGSTLCDLQVLSGIRDSACMSVGNQNVWGMPYALDCC